MLLSFPAIPRTSQVEDILLSKTVKPRTRPGKVVPKSAIQISESEHSSDSEQEEVTLSRYVPPYRRRPDRLHATNVSVGTTTWSQDHIEDTNMLNITSSSSGPSFRSVSSSDVQSSLSASTSNSTRDFSGNTPPMAPPKPRRSGRNRQAPQRFGDWVYQQSVENPVSVEYFV